MTTLILRRDSSEAYREILLAACTENLQYDRQCEENRAEWFVRLIDLADLRTEALERALAFLPTADPGWDRDWAIDLLGEFAKTDTRAWGTLADLCAESEERAYSNLAESGEQGLAWIADQVVPNLPEDERWRIGMWLPDEERDDATPTQRRLRALAQEHEARREANRPTTRKPLPTARQYLDKRGDSNLHPFEFAKIATRKEWREAAELFLAVPPNRRLLRLHMAFRNRDFPLPLRRLFAQATHPERGWAVCRVLEHIDAPQVRRFARKMIQTRPLPWNAIRTLAASFRKGDEALVASVFPDAVDYDAEDRHNVVLDLIVLMFDHPEAVWQPHAEWVYEHSPCSMCRLSAVNWMAQHGHLPVAILEEAPYDAEPEIRKVGARLVPFDDLRSTLPNDASPLAP